MAKRNQIPNPLTIKDIREKFLSLMAEDFSKAYGVKSIHEIWTDKGLRYHVDFITTDDKFTNVLKYIDKYSNHQVKCIVYGADLDEIYKKLEFLHVSYIFGYVS